MKGTVVWRYTLVAALALIAILVVIFAIYTGTKSYTLLKRFKQNQGKSKTSETEMTLSPRAEIFSERYHGVARRNRDQARNRSKYMAWHHDQSSHEQDSGAPGGDIRARFKRAREQHQPQ